LWSLRPAAVGFARFRPLSSGPILIDIRRVAEQGLATHEKREIVMSESVNVSARIGLVVAELAAVSAVLAGAGAFAVGAAHGGQVQGAAEGTAIAAAGQAGQPACPPGQRCKYW
jgi:hypothetical protein